MRNGIWFGIFNEDGPGVLTEITPHTSNNSFQTLFRMTLNNKEGKKKCSTSCKIASG